MPSFCTLWPMTGYPNHVRHGDRNAWDASEYLATLIRRPGMDSGEAAAVALRRLVDAASDGYTPVIQAVAAEQQRLRVESTYTPPTLGAVAAIARDRAPADIHDLQAFMLEELDVVQDKIKGDDTDSWRAVRQHARDGSRSTYSIWSVPDRRHLKRVRDHICSVAGTSIAQVGTIL